MRRALTRDRLAYLSTSKSIVRFRRLTLACLVLLATGPANAQSYDPQGSGVIVSAVEWLQGTLMGTVATVVAVIAVAAVGWLSELGMYHYKARLYSPTLGRFLQTDPIGYDDQINLYAYVANDPMNETDPSGECPSCAGAIIGGGIELVDQYQSGELGRTIDNVGSALREGNLLGALKAAGPSTLKVVVAGGSGAVGGGVLSRAQLALGKLGGAAAVGAGSTASTQAGKNAIEGKSVGSGTLRSAVAGAAGGAAGQAAGRAVGKAVFDRGTARISPGATRGSRDLSTADARQQSREAATRAATTVEAGAGLANSSCGKLKCE